ncbi:uncharacterized protein K460DRAFT_337801 [Cucurbitaria berberidis CBS 394.84]|uniref:Uncharacterized protein n=1 Tax=Cucurbitaria berberidis CBS 394.84 TaxID=1168544 RepID=A0A9P4L7Z9_9PLEO|nr:uncharacterized protein K460DRAFT_337801 [Cucurbitaria berberidis CBS 394.84]KAF1845511.1 hypothetical protein K460DRAFT_337801 [Cucurbitaria berberidis CBS 394.84]
MVLSPRNRAPPTTIPTFNQTWDDNGAAYLDPNSLPVSKIPRGWERKQEVKRLGEGKERKIWRKFGLRSRATNTTEEEDEEEQQDSQSRAVKKLQRMSPKAMEKTTTGLNGKKRTFKATRWDRRKSVLPRKKSAPVEEVLVDTEVENDIHIQDRDDSHLELEVTGDQLVKPAQSLLPEVNDQRSTFTFTIDAPTVDGLPDYESLSGLEDTGQTIDLAPTEDTTLTNLFRSPAKSMRFRASPGSIEYPELPCSDNEETELETHIEPNGIAEEMEEAIESSTAEEASFKAERHENHTSELWEAVGADEEVTHSSLEILAVPVEFAYPHLPVETQETITPPTFEESRGDSDFAETSGTTLESHLAGEELQFDDTGEVLLNSPKGQDSEEELTEASIQLSIQREYEEVHQEERIAPIGVDKDSQAEQTAPEMDVIMGDELGSVEEVVEDSKESEALQDSSSPPKAHEEFQPEVAPTPQKRGSVEAPMDDIADGLTLSFTSAKTPSADPTPRKLHSPPPPPRTESGPEDVTMTVAIDDDTAILKDFLNRAAASKAEKAVTVTHRRESLQNRRDSDVIRHALASPRKVLEDKDPNSPSKYDNEPTLDLSQTLTLSMPTDVMVSPIPEHADAEGPSNEKSLRGSRRSSRTKKSRLPAPASVAQTQASKIAIRRADGNEVVVLKKSDTQEVATMTRANTRKNKQGAFGVTVRLLKLALDAVSLPPVDDSTKELIVGKNVRWDEQLAYYQENPETVANLLAEAESLATPDELSISDPSSTPTAKKRTTKNSTPKSRRVRGLGTANGTPGRGLLAPASLLPDAVQEEKEASQAPAQQLPKPRANKTKKMPVASTSIDSGLSSNPSDTKLPALDIVPVGIVSATQRKSRLAAPKKVMLPQPISAISSEGKENTQRPGIGDATPRKGIPAPKVIVPPTAGMESGMPRRRGRKY